MLFRYRARNYPDKLNDEEKRRWQEFRLARLTSSNPGAGVSFEEHKKLVESLRNSGEMTAEQLAILDKLDAYAENLLHQE
jgi:exodeoxyribonuclease-1